MTMHNPQLPNREAVRHRYARAIAESHDGKHTQPTMEDYRSADAILALIPSPDQGEAEYVTITLSRDGTVTSHNAFDADFDEMVVAIQTIVAALQARLEGRGRCPYSHGAVLRKEPLATPPVDSAKPGEAAAADPQLPCDVRLPPALKIQKGCKLSTLIHALELRGMIAPEPQLGVERPALMTAREEAGRRAYEAMTDNHPTIHSNRFPTFSELSGEQQREWIDRAALTVTSKEGV